MGAIFLDQILVDLLQSRPSSQQPEVAQELGCQGQRGLEEISLLRGQAVHFPMTEFPAKEAREKAKTHLDAGRVGSFHSPLFDSEL